MATRLALPLQIAPSGALVTVPQDSPAEIAQSVGLLLATAPGERRSVPDYGLVEMLGTGFDLDEISDAITEWEDRADPADVEFALNTLVEQQFRVYPATPDTEEA